MNLILRFAWLVLGLAVVIVLWLLGSIYFVPLVVSRFFAAPAFLPSNDNPGLLSVYGTVGDLFGAVNALFSGLALAAIAVTLWVESKSRRESRKPLVISGVDAGDGVVIGRPLRGAKILLPLSISVQVANQSEDAALNVSVEMSIGTSSWEAGVDGPLLKEAAQEVEFKIELPEEAWGPILTTLTEGGDVEAHIATRYRSLEGIDWTTQVTHIFRVRDELFGLLNSARSKTWEQPGVWDPQTQVPVLSHVKRGSWDHYLGKKKIRFWSKWKWVVAVREFFLR